MPWVAAAIVGAAVVGGVVTTLAAEKSLKAGEKGVAAISDANRYAAEMASEATKAAARAMAEATKYAAGLTSKATMEAAKAHAAATKYSADLAKKAADDALALQKTMWEKQEADMEPWMESGQVGLNQLAYGLGLPGYESQAELGDSGYLSKPFDMEDFETDPGYQFRLSEGVKALDRSASASGNLLSGSALKGIERFGQNIASQEYQNAYTRYTGEQAMQYNQLAALSGQGMNAAANLGDAGANYANAASNIMTGTASAIGQNNINSANYIGNLGVNAANTIGAGAINSAGYIGNMGVNTANTIGGYGMNTANAQANAGIAGANANASAYMGWGNALSSAMNQLGYYYGGGGGGGSSTWSNPDTGANWNY